MRSIKLKNLLYEKKNKKTKNSFDELKFFMTICTVEYAEYLETFVYMRKFNWTKRCTVWQKILISFKGFI